MSLSLVTATSAIARESEQPRHQEEGRTGLGDCCDPGLGEARRGFSEIHDRATVIATRASVSRTPDPGSGTTVNTCDTAYILSRFKHALCPRNPDYDNSTGILGRRRRIQARGGAAAPLQRVSGRSRSAPLHGGRASGMRRPAGAAARRRFGSSAGVEAPRPADAALGALWLGGLPSVGRGRAGRGIRGWTA